MSNALVQKDFNNSLNALKKDEIQSKPPYQSVFFLMFRNNFKMFFAKLIKNLFRNS